MRISDWSSDVCSSDLLFEVDLGGTFGLAVPFNLFDHGVWKTFVQETRLVSDPGGRFDWTVGGYYLHRNMFLEGRQASTPGFLAARGLTGLPADATFYQFGSDARRSEEHTSELQSLMRISYAVFCLKKKKKNKYQLHKL